MVAITSPTGGITQLNQAGAILAQFGRADDQFIAHMAPGEAVIPQPLFQDPELRALFFKKMEAAGIDPYQYVVGHDENSINPLTGMPEFGFLSKAWKKIKKVVKKVAPIVLPLAMPFLLPAMPLAASAGLGSLAGNLASGKNFKDSLKGAALAGGIAGLGSAFAGNGFMGSKASLSAGKTAAAAKAGNPAQITGKLPATAFPGAEGAAGAQAGIAGLPAAPPVGAPPSLWESMKKAVTPGDNYGLGSFYKDQLSPSRPSLTAGGDVAAATQKGVADVKSINAARTAAGLPPMDPSAADAMINRAIQEATTTAQPTMLQKWGPLAALGIGGMALGGAFKTQVPEGGLAGGMPPIPEGWNTTGWQELQRDPARYGFDNSQFFGNNPFYAHLATQPTAYTRGQ